MISNLRSGFFDLELEGPPSRSRCLCSRLFLSCRFFSSSGSRGLLLRSIIDDSEFLRMRRASDFLGEFEGSAKISSSLLGCGLLSDAGALRSRIAPSCERLGRWPGGPRGGTFSPRADVAAEYCGEGLSLVFNRGGGGRMPLLAGALSLSVRLSFMVQVSKGVVLKPLSGFFENQLQLSIRSCSFKGRGRDVCAPRLKLTYK